MADPAGRPTPSTPRPPPSPPGRGPASPDSPRAHPVQPSTTYAVASGGRPRLRDGGGEPARPTSTPASAAALRCDEPRGRGGRPRGAPRPPWPLPPGWRRSLSGDPRAVLGRATTSCASRQVFSVTYARCCATSSRLGIDVTFVDGTDAAAIAAEGGAQPRRTWYSLATHREPGPVARGPRCARRHRRTIQDGGLHVRHTGGAAARSTTASTSIAARRHEGHRRAQRRAARGRRRVEDLIDAIGAFQGALGGRRRRPSARGTPTPRGIRTLPARVRQQSGVGPPGSATFLEGHDRHRARCRTPTCRATPSTTWPGGRCAAAAPWSPSRSPVGRRRHAPSPTAAGWPASPCRSADRRRCSPPRHDRRAATTPRSAPRARRHRRPHPHVRRPRAPRRPPVRPRPGPRLTTHFGTGSTGAIGVLPEEVLQGVGVGLLADHPDELAASSRWRAARPASRRAATIRRLVVCSKSTESRPIWRVRWPIRVGEGASRPTPCVGEPAGHRLVGRQPNPP